MTCVQLVFDSLRLDVQPAQDTGHDASLSHATDARYRHDQLAIHASHGATSGCGEHEIRRTMKSLGILLSLEADHAGTSRPVGSGLLDPGQSVRPEQSVGQRIQISHVVVSEPQHGDISRLAAFE